LLSVHSTKEGPGEARTHLDRSRVDPSVVLPRNPHGEIRDSVAIDITEGSNRAAHLVPCGLSVNLVDKVLSRSCGAEHKQQG
jgi:hypothetical protein